MKEEKKALVKARVSEYLKALPKRWFITAFSGMAQGLFVTLIAGTILTQIAGWLGDNAFAEMLSRIAGFAKTLMGVGIGVGIVYSLEKPKLVVFSAGVAGYVGAFADKLITGGAIAGAGNPIGSYVVSVLCVELLSLYAGKTRLDIVLVPLGAMFLSLGASYVAYPFVWAVNQLGVLIAIATKATPFVMGIVIAVVMGILLTMPTSSAAIWISVAKPVIDGGTPEQVEAMLLAGGAAVVGCACHMIGFAVASYRENGVSGLLSQGIGTSMLQIPNIMKKPVIMLPEIVASAVCGPLATCLFALRCDAESGGMGTSGLVGVFGTLSASAGMNGWALGLGIALLMFLLPAGISFLLSELFRKKGIIAFGDQKLD